MGTLCQIVFQTKSFPPFHSAVIMTDPPSCRAFVPAFMWRSGDVGWSSPTIGPGVGAERLTGVMALLCTSVS